MDPVLKVYKNCPVMLTTNTDVGNGQANGTRAYVERVTLRHGVSPTVMLLDGNIPVRTVTASQVEYITLRHQNNRVNPQCFVVSAKPYSVKVRVPKPTSLRLKEDDTEILKMKTLQLPFVMNHATTGHKLQGASVDNLFVHNWYYRTNWVYVVMSRVRTRSGLYCRKPLSLDLSKYAVPKQLTQLLEKFRREISVSPLSEADYDEILA